MFCWFYRLMISHSHDADRMISGLTKNHLSKCAACSRFDSLCRSMGKALTAEAKIINRDYQSLLNEQIISSLEETNINKNIRRINFRPIAIAAGIAFIFLISIFFQRSGQKIETNNDFERAVAEFAGLVNIDRGRELSGLVEKPFETELQNIIDDTTSAAHFLYMCVAVDFDDTEELEQFK